MIVLFFSSEWRVDLSTKIEYSLSASSSMFVPIAVAAFVGVLGWAYQALKPPAPKICGTPGGPPITSPRIKLNDGRHLAYTESGVPKEEAKYKVIIVHGFDSSKDVDLPVPKVQSLFISYNFDKRI
ncbi:alpha/beta-Hydrolases superfamily protein [Euphorbia peplus]|nr:alpha/beta-Hydrolases superfamily protein [Euphorbia peplus]